MVRLLSIGEEPEKGNQLTLEAHELLASSGLRFGGNTEGRGLLEGEADVVVCDGFTGNVALKTLEGTIRSVIGALRRRSLRAPAGSSGVCSFGRQRGAFVSGSIRTHTVARISSGFAVSS